MATTPKNESSRFHFFPASLRLLTVPGVKGHSLVFTMIMTILFGTALVGTTTGFSLAWLIVFTIGASAAGTYLILSFLTLWEKTKSLIFYSKLKLRMIFLGLVYTPLLAGLSYWIYSAGSVEALPIFPIFIIVFYGWVLLQAYFIATPISQLIVKIEKSAARQDKKRLISSLGVVSLLFPAVPLVYSVWTISSWLTSTYENVQGANEKIIAWTVAVLVTLLLTYALTVEWGWKAFKAGMAERSIYAGGTFLVLWSYLLYRATSLAMGYVSQAQPSNPILDSVLIAISIIGAMQTFAKKAIDRGNRRINTILPFLVFTFGSIYAVAQFYFILQFAITRLELSMVVNGIIFGTGIPVMMLIIRSHLLLPPATSLSVSGSSLTVAANTGPSPETKTVDKGARTASSPIFSHLFRRRGSQSHAEGTQEEAATAGPG